MAIAVAADSDEGSRRVLREVVDECDGVLEMIDAATLIARSVRSGLLRAGEDDALRTQLRAIEREADRMHVLGIERTRSRLGYARALLPLPKKWWR